MLKSFTVFNIAQCDGLPERLTAPPKQPNPDQRDALIDEFIIATCATVHETGGDHAYYAGGSSDFLMMPAFTAFRGRTHYASTLFHELIHWTKHPSRLDRKLGARFGVRSPFVEELVAELGGRVPVRAVLDRSGDPARRLSPELPRAARRRSQGDLHCGGASSGGGRFPPSASAGRSRGHRDRGGGVAVMPQRASGYLRVSDEQYETVRCGRCRRCCATCPSLDAPGTHVIAATG